MENPFWFYGRFLGLLGLVMMMVVFNWLTWGFHRPTHVSVWRGNNARPEQGLSLIKKYGCNACHRIPGIDARPRVGPSLEELPNQLFIAGRLSNTPSNLIRWIQRPDQIRPHTAMPDLNVANDDARDIAAYLFDPT